jgi:hypothetical protein
VALLWSSTAKDRGETKRKLAKGGKTVSGVSDCAEGKGRECGCVVHPENQAIVEGGSSFLEIEGSKVPQHPYFTPSFTNPDVYLVGRCEWEDC